MRQIGRITALSEDGRQAIAAVTRTSACSGCHKADPGMMTGGGTACRECTLFPQDTEMTVTAENGAGAAVGDRVILETETQTVLGYAAAVFLLPLALALAGGLLCRLLSDAAWVTALGAVCGFVLAYVFLRLVVDRNASRKTVYTVVKILGDHSGV